MVVAVWRGRLRLLIVATDYPPKTGGIATYGLQLARALSLDHTVTVLAPGRSEEQDKKQPFTIERASYLLLVWKVSRLLKQQVFDAVLHTTWPTALISYLCKGAAIPYFVSAHASEILDDRTSWRRRIKMAIRPLKIRALRHAAGLFPVSRYTAGLLSRMGLGDVPVRVINNGVDIEKFRPANRKGFFSPPRLLTVARLDKHKGHDIALRAVAQLISRGKPLIYRIAGIGEEVSDLKRLADELGIRRFVEFMGFVPDEELPEVYAGSDIFIMLSREIPGRLDLVEGFGISFLEASAAGLPVIAGNSGGVPDAVLDGQTGVLVPPEDVDMVVKTLESMLSEPDMAIKMGRVGRDWVEREMRWGIVATRMVSAMKEIATL